MSAKFWLEVFLLRLRREEVDGVRVRQVVERRAAARKQAAELQSVRDRSACQLAAAKRAQQAAAAAQRSVALSRQIASLQAQALLGAAGAIQVRPSHQGDSEGDSQIHSFMILLLDLLTTRSKISR